MKIFVGEQTIDAEELTKQMLPELSCSQYQWAVLHFMRDWLKGRADIEISTSGSTGDPQKLQVRREDLVRSAQKTIRFFNLGPDDCAFLCLDIRHVGGLMMVVRSLVADMDLIIQAPSSDPLADLPDHLAPTFAAMVPLQVQVSLDRERLSPSSIRTLLVGGAPVDPVFEEQLQGLDLGIYHTFGMSETLSHFAVRRMTGENRSQAYQLLEGWEIRKGEEGRLEVRESSQDRWLITTDEVELLGDRSFKWLGRSDHVINSGGVKIHPEQLERSIREVTRRMNLHNRFFCVGQPDAKFGEIVVMVVEGTADESLQLQLMEELADHLPKYHGPRKIVFVDQFVETENGKVRRMETWSRLSEQV